MTVVIKLKRVYEPREKTDGLRILVERLWPRGLTKEAAGVNHWARDVSPSPDLRAWFSHDPGKWTGFQSRYRAELSANAEAVEALRTLIAGKAVTFVFAAKDEERCSAALLKSFLESENGLRRSRAAAIPPPLKSAPRRPAGRRRRSTA